MCGWTFAFRALYVSVACVTSSSSRGSLLSPAPVYLISSQASWLFFCSSSFIILLYSIINYRLFLRSLTRTK
ncbi:hypothetical protein LZ30DRAFT_145098 [Colletotrichum cereale]|nr:hypothetical protein LZ30DRAFT_145098 [Colletotrichum cereale]